MKIHFQGHRAVQLCVMVVFLGFFSFKPLFSQITLTCPPNLSVSCTMEIPPTLPFTGTATTTCVPNTVTVTHLSDVISNQTCADRYTLTRTYRATDQCGNVATCQRIITVNDQTPPIVICPPNTTVQCFTDIPLFSVQESDNCNGAMVMVIMTDTTNRTCYNRFTLTRTVRATDSCGNSATCSQVITVNDNNGPTITCPGPLTVSCAAQVPPPDTNLVIVSDGCTGGSITRAFVSDVISGQTCANRYTLTRTYRATDICGNVSTCTQIITVNDQTPPTLTCPGPLTVSCSSDVPPPNISLVTGVSDNCVGTVTVSHISDVISGQTCANRYTLTRTYRATDVCGNTAQCTQIITVNDQTPPTLTCPGPITVSCAPEIPPVNTNSVTGVSDNCPGTVTISHISDVTSGQTCTNRFTVTRTYRATDVCGNTAQCTQIITVNDQTPPVIVLSLIHIYIH